MFWVYVKLVKVYLVFSILLFVVLVEVSLVFLGIWFVCWSLSNVILDKECDMYLGVYGGFGFL